MCCITTGLKRKRGNNGEKNTLDEVCNVLFHSAMQFSDIQNKSKKENRKKKIDGAHNVIALGDSSF